MTLMEYLPAGYGNSREVRALEGSLDAELMALWQARDGLFEQMDIQTATWGLAHWERYLGIQTEAEKPLAFRRARIISKLRGQGTTTVAMVRNVAESFSNGAVEIREHPAAYSFELVFVGTIGLPPNMADLTAAIEEIKPAHLAFSYVFIYRTHAQLSPKTHDELAAFTHETLRSGGMD